MTSAPIVDRIRIIPRPQDFLNRNVGSSGEVFFNKETSSLRVYSGRDASGFEIARADLANVSDSDFLSKATAAGIGSGASLGITYTENTNLLYAEGEYDFSNNIIKYANAVDQESDLANYSPSTYHGMTMHVHNTGALYYAHAGEWRKLLTDTSYNDVVGAGYTDPLSTVAYSGSYNDLTDKPSSAGGASVDVSLSAPSSPEQGNIWYDLNDGKIYIYINDGDSQQWVQPVATSPSFSGDYNDLTNKPSIPTSLLNLGISDGTNGQVLTTDGVGNFTFTTVSGGSSYDQSLNTTDNVAFASVTAASFVNNGVGSPSITSASTITLSAQDGVDVTNNLNVDGLLTLRTTTERYGQITAATGTVDHDFSETAVFYHLNIGSNFTANFTNIPVQDLRTISVALILNQGATPYMPTALEIDGVAQTINWQGGVAPTGTTLGVDVVSFTLIKVGVNWTVIGSSTSYS